MIDERGETRRELLQDVRGFSVQIRHAASDQPIGTGFIVSWDGKVVTCAHVVHDALGIEARDALGLEVGVYFARNSELRKEAQERRARVIACFPQHDDDVVLLHILGDLPTIGQPAVLGVAQELRSHRFQSFGYRRLDDYSGLPAQGEIVGFGDFPINRAVQWEPLILKSQGIDSGMSGAAVLDTEINRVVGIISETWESAGSAKDRDAAFAVAAQVLTFPPLDLLLNAELPPAYGPHLRTDSNVQVKILPLAVDLTHAPQMLEEWVGRHSLIANLDAAWRNLELRVVGLIGFGGEGKTSLARYWVDKVKTSDVPPEGIFWWSFYENRNLNEFWKAIVSYFYSGQIDLNTFHSANARAQLVAATLRKRGCLLIMDGLEVVQEPQGDQYGELNDPDLRQFLQLCAEPGHNSLCLITSRAPLVDLLRYPGYGESPVEALNIEEGRALLRGLGVRGLDSVLDTVVHDWGGHALTLALLASYIVNRWQGDITSIKDLPPPTADEPHYKRVHRVLRRYDEHLSEEEKIFLTLFSAFRTPVGQWMIEQCIRAKIGPKALNSPIVRLHSTEFEKLLQRLVEYRILRYNAEEGLYHLHPLIRAHYLDRFRSYKPQQTRPIHRRISEFYFDFSTFRARHILGLSDLEPAFEAVHHACHAGMYDKALSIYYSAIEQRENRFLTGTYGAYYTALEVLREFFPSGNLALAPQVSMRSAATFILNAVGLCLVHLGRLGEAALILERSIKAHMEAGEWASACASLNNLAATHINMGAFTPAAQAAQQSLDFARRSGDKRSEYTALTLGAFTAYLRGDQVMAAVEFKAADAVLQQIDTSYRYPCYDYPFGISGIYQADYYRRFGNLEYARKISEANVEMCLYHKWPGNYSQCHRVLGDLDDAEGKYKDAQEHYDEAVRVARLITEHDVLIEVLQARGRWVARRGGTNEQANLQGAYNDLNEALDYALSGGYRIYEADVCVGLAWVHRAMDTLVEAEGQAKRALTISREAGYYWGQVDAEEVLKAL